MTTLSIDFGAGNFKMCGPLGCVILASHTAMAGREHLGRADGITVRRKPTQITVEHGGSFYVGLGAHEWGYAIENLADERFLGTPDVKALTYGTLSLYAQEYGHPADPLELWVGLPQSALSESRGSDIKSAIREWLGGVHAWTCDGQHVQVDVTEVKIAPQATGALFDYLIQDGQLVQERKAHYAQEVGVVSIGMNSIELQVTQGKAVNQNFTASANRGVRRLLEIADQRKLYTRGELDSRLRDGSLNLNGHGGVWASEVTGFIETSWGQSHRRFAVNIAVGGGVGLLRRELSTYFRGRIHIPDEPILAVARGLYKLGELNAAQTT